MREIRVDSGSSHVTLGRVGENRVAQLLIDTSDWAREFPGGRLALFIERPDGRKYIAAVENSGGSWAYTLTSADLAMAGRGRMQLQWMVDEQIARSKILDTVTMPSIMASEGPPGYPEQGYLEQMAAIGAQAALDADRAEAAADGLSGMGARAVTLEPGSEATVEVTEGPDGGKTLVFGVPRGEAGGGEVHELSKEDVDEVLTILKEDDELA